MKKGSGIHNMAMQLILWWVFTSLFCTSSNPNNFDEILEQIPTTVIDDMNRHLTEEFIAQEVELALKHMAPLKSPGLDGMPPLFFIKVTSLW